GPPWIPTAGGAVVDGVAVVVVVGAVVVVVEDGGGAVVGGGPAASLVLPKSYSRPSPAAGSLRCAPPAEPSASATSGALATSSVSPGRASGGPPGPAHVTSGVSAVEDASTSTPTPSGARHAATTARSMPPGRRRRRGDGT